MKRPLLLLAVLLTGACVQQPTQNNTIAPTAVAGNGDQAFKAVHDKYVLEFLRRNPSVNTYLGGAGLDPSLKVSDGHPRDHSAAALAEADRWLAGTQKALEGTDPPTPSAAPRIASAAAPAPLALARPTHQ